MHQEHQDKKEFQGFLQTLSREKLEAAPMQMRIVDCVAGFRR